MDTETQALSGFEMSKVIQHSITLRSVMTITTCFWKLGNLTLLTSDQRPDGWKRMEGCISTSQGSQSTDGFFKENLVEQRMSADWQKPVSAMPPTMPTILTTMPSDQNFNCEKVLNGWNPRHRPRPWLIIRREWRASIAWKTPISLSRYCSL